MVVYLDGVVGLNFLVDWMLLLGVNRLAGYPPGARRTAAAAAVGGGYAGMCLVPGFAFLASGLWRAVSLGIMSVAAFGMGRSAWTRGVLFVLLSMAMGGLAVSFDSGNFPGLVLCAGSLAVLCQMGFRRVGAGKTYQTVKIGHNGLQVELNALVDTGNTLRDPISGESVTVVDAVIGERLLGISAERLRSPVEAMERMQGFRLIPCRTVGNSGGFLLALRCDRVEIGGKQAGKLIAFARESFPGGEYQGLTGGQYG